MKKPKTGISLETLAGGALAERVNAALMDAVVNMMSPDTDAKKKRRVNIAIDLIPSESRRVAGASISVTTKLAPPASVKTSLLMGVNQLGEIEVSEYGDQIPGQMDLAELEEGKPLSPKEGKVRGFDAATGEIIEEPKRAGLVDISKWPAVKAGGEE